MRRIILLLTLSYLAQISKAQPVLDTLPWCPPGATWVYLVSCRTCNLYYELSYEKDTIVLGYDTKKLNTRLIELNGFNLSFRKVTNLNPEFLVKTGDSISIIDSGQVKLLYKVKATIGEKYEIHIVRQVCQSGQSVSFTDSVIVGASSWLDTIENKIYNSYSQIGIAHSKKNQILENIGPKDFFFNGLSYSYCASPKASFAPGFENEMNWLVCYSDSLRGSISFDRNKSTGLFGCHSIRTQIDNIDNSTVFFKFYPNPVYDVITIDTELSIHDATLKVFDMVGKLVLTKKVTNSNVDVSSLKSGAYIGQIETNTLSKRIRFIKSN